MSTARRLLFVASLTASFTSACAPEEATGTHHDEAVVCGRGPTVPGIDVSEWQGSIDWNAVAAAGYQFAIVRISDGSYRDVRFNENWPAVQAVGMIRGAYQFFEPQQDPNMQADIVIAAVGRLGPNDLPVTLDVEEPNPGVSPGEYAARIHTWVDRVTAGTGRAPMIYTGRYYWDPYVASGDFSSLRLWHAQYTSASCPNISDYWGDWAFWQFTSTGSVPGIGGNVDTNRFNGTIEELRALAQSNRAPIGYLDNAGCDTITGWAQDPDAPDSPIDVHIYIGGPAGSGAPGVPTHANQHRDDLCTAIGSCNHGYTLLTPLSFLDGMPHDVFAYGIDAIGGNNPLLGSAPRTLQCNAPEPPLPSDNAVRRHVPNPTVLAAWQWSGLDVLVLPEATVNRYVDGPDVVDAPVIVQGMGDPRVQVLEYSTLRHVPDPAAMDAWRFDWGAIQQRDPAQVATMLDGAQLPGRPFLVRPANGPAVYLIDSPPPLWAELVSDDVPTEMEAGASYTATFTFRNRGSMTWNSNVVLAAASPRTEESPLCDRTHSPTCRDLAAFARDVGHGAMGSVSVALRAPSTPGTTVHACFGLHAHDDHWFGDPGQMGPADDAMCRDVRIVAAGAIGDGGVRTDGGVAHGDASADGSSMRPGASGSCGCRVPGRRGRGDARTAVLALLAIGAFVYRRARR